MNFRATVLTVSVLSLTATALLAQTAGKQEPGKSAATPASATKAPPLKSPAPTAKDWADIAKLPDWSGIWNPNITDQDKQIGTNMPPWKPEFVPKVQHMQAEAKAGRPAPIVVSCLPQGMPAWMLITHNALEFLFSPGRVTMLGESDGNRLRRIFTDGRGHNTDGEEYFHGHSIGHWEGDTLVVDTINIKPQTMFAISEAIGFPNNGDVHVIERIHLVKPDVLHNDIEIHAPHLLTKPWKTTREYFRQRARKFEFVEGVCLEGNYSERVDKDGNHVFVEIARDPMGNIVAPKRQ